jgi:hypothetical protein
MQYVLLHAQSSLGLVPDEYASGQDQNLASARPVVVGLVLSYLFSGPTEETLHEAVENRHVQVSVKAEGETTATFSVSRLEGGPSTFTVIIPAGTLISNSDTGGQSLMTAMPLVIHFQEAQSNATVTAETYCLNQFNTPPTLASTLDVATVPEYSSHEIEPIRKLADCLAGQTEDLGNRQLSIWMVAEGLTDKSYYQVDSLLREKHGQQSDAQIRSGLRDELVRNLRQNFPGKDEQWLRDQTAFFERNTLEGLIADDAKKIAETELKGFITSARTLLDVCGHNTAEMRFFKTAPLIS